MGFISNIAGTISDSINSEIDDQYLESFRTDSLGQDTLVRRAYRQNSRGRNQGSSDVITAGSKVLVPEGTYALMIDEGKELLKAHGIDPERYIGIGNCVLGYMKGDYPEAAPRKEKYVYWIE